MPRPKIAALAAVVVALTLTLAPRAARADEAIDLAWKFHKGDTLRWRMIQEQIQKATGLRDGEATQTNAVVFRQEVTDVAADGTASITSTYEAARFDLAQGGEPRVSYDSTKPEDQAKVEDPRIRPIASFVGQKVTYRVSPRGDVSNVQGYEQIVERAMAGLAQNPMTAQFAASLKASLGNDAMERQLEQMFRVVPEKPVAPGDSWKQTIEAPVPIVGTMRSETTYTLVGLEGSGDGRRAKIGVAATITLGAAPKPDPANPMSGMFKVALRKGELKGEVLFDPARGRIVKGATRTEMEIEIEIAMGAPGGAGPKGATGTAVAPAGPKSFQKTEQNMVLVLLEAGAPPF